MGFAAWNESEGASAAIAQSLHDVMESLAAWQIADRKRIMRNAPALSAVHAIPHPGEGRAESLTGARKRPGNSRLHAGTGACRRLISLNRISLKGKGWVSCTVQAGNCRTARQATSAAATGRGRVKIMFDRLEDWQSDVTRQDRCSSSFSSANAPPATISCGSHQKSLKPVEN